MGTTTQDKILQLMDGTEVTGIRKFPLTDYADDSGGMWLFLKEYEYSRPSLDSMPKYNPTAGAVEIYLPIPHNLRAGYNVRWNQSDMGAFGNALASKDNQAAIVNAAKNIYSGAVESGKNATIQSLIDGIRTGVGDLSNIQGIASGIATDAMYNNGAFGYVGVAQGVARNPFTAMLFDGVNFRTFNFTYLLVPRSLDEANEIRMIIKALKYGMHPSFAGSDTGLPAATNGLFKYPFLYKPTLIMGGASNEYLFDFGMCAITGLDVDYHATGAPAYIGKDGKKIPAAIHLSFQLTEMEIVTKENISRTTNPQDVGR